MTEEGKIVKTDKKNATVRIERKSICDSCEHKCGMGSHAKYHDVILANELGGQVGEMAIIQFADNIAVKFATIVYLIPLVLACIGLFVAISLNLSELIQLLICIGALVISAFITYIIDKKYRNSKNAPKIIKIIK